MSNLVCRVLAAVFDSVAFTLIAAATALLAFVVITAAFCSGVYITVESFFIMPVWSDSIFNCAVLYANFVMAVVIGWFACGIIQEAYYEILDWKERRRAGRLPPKEGSPPRAI